MITKEKWDNRENIVTKINDKIKKIKSPWIGIPIIIFVNLIICSLAVGYLIFPFIKYNYLPLKIVFSLLWSIGAGFVYSVAISMQDKSIKTDLLSKIASFSSFSAFLVCLFIHNNFYSFGNLISAIKWGLIISFFILCFFVLIKIIKNEIKLFIETLCLVMVGFLFFVLFKGSLSVTSVDETVKKYVSIISLFVLFALFFGFCLTVFYKKEKMKYIYFYASIFIGAIVIILIVASLIDHFDDAISFMQAFLTLLASVVGGGLTVFGVAWTIKRQDEYKEKEEKQKAKPFFGIVDLTNYKSGKSASHSIEFRPRTNNVMNFCLEVCLENSDKVPFYIEKVVVGTDECCPDSTLLVTKEMLFEIDVYREKGERNAEEKIFLHVIDVNYNKITYELIPTHQNYGFAYDIKEIDNSRNS